jgi:hypothetical protein
MKLESGLCLAHKTQEFFSANVCNLIPSFVYKLHCLFEPAISKYSPLVCQLN